MNDKKSKNRIETWGEAIDCPAFLSSEPCGIENLRFCVGESIHATIYDEFEESVVGSIEELIKVSVYSAVLQQ